MRANCLSERRVNFGQRVGAIGEGDDDADFTRWNVHPQSAVLDIAAAGRTGLGAIQTLGTALADSGSP